MSYETVVAEHYTHGELLESIRSSIQKLGKTPENVTIDDLGPVDEFHIGGRVATERFLGHLNFTELDHILDVGCGIGGTSRFIASRYGSRVTGIDLTLEYIDTGEALSRWVGLNNQVFLRQGNVLSMPFEDESFDGAIMMHVGMNIEDKAKLFSELNRVLRPDATLGVYDVMRTGEGDFTYPVPWSTISETSSVASPEYYKHAMRKAGFNIKSETNRGEFAVEFFNEMRAWMETNGGPPPLGLHTLMGENTMIKIQNMIDNIAAGFTAPVEIIAKKR